MKWTKYKEYVFNLKAIFFLPSCMFCCMYVTIYYKHFFKQVCMWAKFVMESTCISMFVIRCEIVWCTYVWMLISPCFVCMCVYLCVLYLNETIYIMDNKPQFTWKQNLYQLHLVVPDVAVSFSKKIFKASLWDSFFTSK